MNYNDLLQSNYDDMQRRRKYMQDKSLKELAAYASNPIQDYRNVIVAKQLLHEKGVTDIPE